MTSVHPMVHVCHCSVWCGDHYTVIVGGEVLPRYGAFGGVEAVRGEGHEDSGV
jgi:hypothetical protein